jgi:hypothetical protein
MKSWIYRKPEDDITRVLQLEGDLVPAAASASRRSLPVSSTAGSSAIVVVRRGPVAEPPQYAGLALLIGAAKAPDARSKAESLAVARAV